MTEKLIDYLNYWLTKTSPVHKILDVGILFIAVTLGGFLYLGYQSQADIRRIAISSLEKTPRLNDSWINDNFDKFAAESITHKAVRVCLYVVDLSANTIRLSHYKTANADDKTLDKILKGSKKTAFIHSGMTQNALSVASSLMAGDATVADSLWDETDTCLFVPIPDRSGAFLVGMITIAFDGQVQETDPNIAELRLLSHEFAEGAIR